MVCLIGEGLVAPAVDGPGEPGELGDVGVGGVPKNTIGLRFASARSTADRLGKEFTGEPDRGDFAIWVRRVGSRAGMCVIYPSALTRSRRSSASINSSPNSTTA